MKEYKVLKHCILCTKEYLNVLHLNFTKFSEASKLHRSHCE